MSKGQPVDIVVRGAGSSIIDPAGAIHIKSKVRYLLMRVGGRGGGLRAGVLIRQGMNE